MPASSQRIGEIQSRLERLEIRVDAVGVELRDEIRSSDEETPRILALTRPTGSAESLVLTVITNWHTALQP